MNKIVMPASNKRSLGFLLVLFLFVGTISIGYPSGSAMAQWATSGNNIYNTNTGNVGIGTATPTQKLDVFGDVSLGYNTANTSQLIKTFATGHASGNVPSSLKIGIADGADVVGMQVTDVRDGSFNSQSLAFYTHHGGVSSGTRMSIDKDGNVGIGTTATPSRLTVDAGLVEIRSGNYLLLRPAANDWDYRLRAEGTQFNIYSGGDPSNPKMSILNNGRVGIGRVTPSNTLDVNGGATISGSLSAGNTTVAGSLSANSASISGSTTVSGSLNAGNTTVSGSLSASSATISNGATVSGNLGVGTTVPFYRLDVSGDARATGTMYAQAFTLQSDLRYKKNIETISNALDKVMRLRGVNFDWRQDEFPDQHFGKARQIGFVAQEVKEVLPEVVSQDINGFYGMGYSSVVPLLVEAIKEQQKVIDELKKKTSEIDELKAKIDKLSESKTTLVVRVC